MRKQTPRFHAGRIIENYTSNGLGDPRQSDDHAVAVAYLDQNEWIDDEAIETVKELITECPGEILRMAAALVNLDITTRDYAGDLQADGFVFKAEEAIERANKYRDTLNELCRIWGDGVDITDVDSLPELTDEERQAMNRIPADIVDRLWNEADKSSGHNASETEKTCG